VSGFTRSISNRLFAALLSSLLAIPTGWGLWLYWSLDHSNDGQDFISRAFLHVGIDIVAILFFLSLLGLIWAIFTPRWVERILKLVTNHFLEGLAFLLAVILLMLGYAIFINTRT